MKTCEIFLAVLVTIFANSSLAGTVVINDGGTRLVTTGGGPTGDPTEFIVRDLGCGSPDPIDPLCQPVGTPTTVEFHAIEDGEVSGLRVFDTSTIIVDGTNLTHTSGMSLGSIEASGDSHVQVKNGTFSAVSLSDFATAEITGGRSREGGVRVALEGSATATIAAETFDISLSGASSATFTGSAIAVSVSGQSNLTILDGSISALGATGGEILLHSGSIVELQLMDTKMTVLHGTPHSSSFPINVFGSSELRLNGAVFRLNGLPAPLGEILATSGTLEVIYANGDSYVTDFLRAPNASLILAPEPQPALLIALGLLAIASTRPVQRT